MALQWIAWSLIHQHRTSFSSSSSSSTSTTTPLPSFSFNLFLFKSNFLTPTGPYFQFFGAHVHLFLYSNSSKDNDNDDDADDNTRPLSQYLPSYLILLPRLNRVEGGWHTKWRTHVRYDEEEDVGVNGGDGGDGGGYCEYYFDTYCTVSKVFY